MELISASAALAITKEKVEVINPTRQDVIGKIIRRAAEIGKTSVTIPDYIIYDRFDDSVGEKIIKELKELGYTLSSDLDSKDIAIGSTISWAEPEEDDYITKEDMENAFE